MYKLLSIRKSPNKKYKLQVDLYNTETKRIKIIRFGANGMKDYTIYNREEGKQVADEHKERYIKRHQKREDWTKSGILTRGFWSKHLLWSQKTLKESINDTIKRFNLN